jgi:signal transduction histidine kinase
MPSALLPENYPVADLISEARLATLADLLDAGVLVEDEHGRVVLANQALVRVLELGLPPHRLRGTSLSLEEVRARNGQVLRRERVPVVVDGEARGHVSVLRDVSADAAAHEHARARGELAALRTQFVATVSHELRTPLTSIATLAGMLAEDGSRLPAADRDAAIDAIRRGAQRLRGLVEDFVLLATLESGEVALDLEPVDVAALVVSVPGPVALDIGVGPPVMADRDLLEKLVRTVVAVLSGSEVAVCAGVDGSDWYISVSTATADAATVEFLTSQRTGALGVLLARAVAERHGGSLDVAVRHPGAQITVRIPIRSS